MKHLADHRESSKGARLVQFLRIARDRSEAVWSMARQRPFARGENNARVVQFVRIEKGHQE